MERSAPIVIVHFFPQCPFFFFLSSSPPLSVRRLAFHVHVPAQTPETQQTDRTCGQKRPVCRLLVDLFLVRLSSPPPPPSQGSKVHSSIPLFLAWSLISFSCRCRCRRSSPIPHTATDSVDIMSMYLYQVDAGPGLELGLGLGVA